MFAVASARFCFSAESEFYLRTHMISGITSSGTYSPQSFVTKVKTSTGQPAQAPAPEVQPEPQPADLRAPEGDEQALTREFNLFDLAIRQFAQILPRLELATVPVE
jgi:hypothetical protein